MIDQTSDDLLQDLLNGNNDPWMFHQANTRDYDGAGHSLLSDLLDRHVRQVRGRRDVSRSSSPTMDDLAVG